MPTPGAAVPGDGWNLTPAGAGIPHVLLQRSVFSNVPGEDVTAPRIPTRRDIGRFKNSPR